MARRLIPLCLLLALCIAPAAASAAEPLPLKSKHDTSPARERAPLQ